MDPMDLRDLEAFAAIAIVVLFVFGLLKLQQWIERRHDQMWIESQRKLMELMREKDAVEEEHKRKLLIIENMKELQTNAEYFKALTEMDDRTIH